MNTQRLGWVCPTCKMTWAPFINECLNCNFTNNLSQEDPNTPLNEQKGVKVDFFREGKHMGTPFTKFKREALLAWLDKNTVYEEKSVLGETIASLKDYLART